MRRRYNVALAGIIAGLITGAAMWLLGPGFPIIDQLLLQTVVWTNELPYWKRLLLCMAAAGAYGSLVMYFSQK